MRLRRIAAGLALGFAGLSAPCEAAEGSRVVQEALSFESGGKVIDTAVFRPNDDGKHPTVIYLHGGGFSFEDPVMARFNTELAKRGLVVLAPHYLLNRTGYYDWQKTATNAVTFALTLPSVDPDHIGMSGISMGGQTVLSAAARDRRVKAVAEFFTAWPGSLPDEPIAALPPVLLLNGTADPVIPFDKAMVLDQILKEHNLPFERHVYQGLGHGFSTAASFNDAVLRTSAFFGGQLEGPGSSPGPINPAFPIGYQSGSPAAFLEIGDDDLVYAWTWTRSAVIVPRKKKRRPGATNPVAPRTAPIRSRVAKS
jgi:dienelactone hydrolase